MKTMRKIDLLAWMLIVICFVLVVYDITIQQGEGGKCLDDPLVYGVSSYEPVYNEELVCSCTHTGGNSPILYVTKEGSQILRIESELDESSINHSKTIREGIKSIKQNNQTG